MRVYSPVALFLALAAFGQGFAQEGKKQDREENFAKDKPAVGETLPELSVFAPDGSELKTDALRGHYAVLTFGCLT